MPTTPLRNPLRTSATTTAWELDPVVEANADPIFDENARASELFGCPIEDFLLYLESKFEPGMSWDNWDYGGGTGKWRIDHIMPSAIFDLTRPDHQKHFFHFSNQQPMWAPENII